MKYTLHSPTTIEEKSGKDVVHRVQNNTSVSFLQVPAAMKKSVDPRVVNDILMNDLMSIDDRLETCAKPEHF